MLKCTKILLCLGGEVFQHYGVCNSIGWFSKKEKVYKTMSRKKTTTNIWQEVHKYNFTVILMFASFFLVFSAYCPCSSSYSFCYTWMMSSKHGKLLFSTFINVSQLISLCACWQPAKITLWWIVKIGVAVMGPKMCCK